MEEGEEGPSSGSWSAPSLERSLPSCAMKDTVGERTRYMND